MNFASTPVAGTPQGSQPVLQTIHGGALAYAGAGCLILGKSGSGKSRLMAEMIVHGARLVADDRVVLSEQSGMVVAGAPKELAGVMELRGLGLIRVNDAIPRHVIHIAIEITDMAPERLPEPKTTNLLGHTVKLIQVPPPPHINAQSLLLYLKAMQEGRILPPDWHPAA